jgi:hypothetical protein
MNMFDNSIGSACLAAPAYERIYNTAFWYDVSTKQASKAT